MGSQAPMAGDWESAKTGNGAATTRSSTPMPSSRVRQGLRSQDIVDSPLGSPVSYAAPRAYAAPLSPVEPYKLAPRGSTNGHARRVGRHRSWLSRSRACRDSKARESFTGVLARYLHTNVWMVENWERGLSALS